VQSAHSDPAETYRILPDEEIASLLADQDSLTPDARSALLAEIRQRGLTETQLQKMHSVELRHEAQFDRLESFRRRKLAWGRLPSTPREWMFAILAFIALILISELMSRPH
jgi:hypothetical protein